MRGGVSEPGWHRYNIEDANPLRPAILTDQCAAIGCRGDRCSLSLDLSPRVPGVAITGRKAYEIALSDLQIKNPTDPQNGTNADRTFALRMKENFQGRADGDRLRL